MGIVAVVSGVSFVSSIVVSSVSVGCSKLLVVVGLAVSCWLLSLNMTVGGDVCLDVLNPALIFHAETLIDWFLG